MRFMLGMPIAGRWSDSNSCACYLPDLPCGKSRRTSRRARRGLAGPAELLGIPARLDPPGEWSAAKKGYVKSRSDWFNCRRECYLALGRPCVLQDYWLEQNYPSGDGLFAFTPSRKPSPRH